MKIGSWGEQILYSDCLVKSAACIPPIVGVRVWSQSGADGDDGNGRMAMVMVMVIVLVMVIIVPEALRQVGRLRQCSCKRIHNISHCHC